MTRKQRKGKLPYKEIANLCGVSTEDAKRICKDADRRSVAEAFEREAEPVSVAVKIAQERGSIPLMAFAHIIPRWQEARHRTGSGLATMNYHNEVGEGYATHKRRSSVAPCVSDFVADVELQVLKALNPEELQYFRDYYRDADGQLDDVPEERRKLDTRVREKCGRHFAITSKWAVQDGEEVMVFRGVDLYVPFKEARCFDEVNPLGRYMAAVDVHGPRKVTSETNVVEMLPPSFQDEHVFVGMPEVAA